jgi:hypothetical protein
MAGNPKSVLNRLGNPVKGGDFWPRHDVVGGLFNDLIEDRGSRSLFGLRRIGKTSVLLALEDKLRSDQSRTVIRLDVQGLSRFKDFLVKVFEQIPVEGKLDQARQRLATNTPLQTLIPGLFSLFSKEKMAPPPAGFLNEFDHNAVWAGDIEAALKEAGPIFLLVDELPYMLRNMMKDGYKAWDVERFMATLRSWRMNAGVRMVLAGSLGFGQLRRLERVEIADHIGDVFPVTLPPLEHEDAVAMVQALAMGENVPDWGVDQSTAVVQAAAELWPIFLQYGFGEARRSQLREPSAIQRIASDASRRALEENFYDQFTTRLDRYQSDLQAARLMLKTIVAKAPASFAEIDAALEKLKAVDRRDDLLEALREDDFIHFSTEAQTAQPASRLVPVWVRARSWGR